MHWNAVLLKLGLLRNAGAGDVRPRNGGRSSVFMFVEGQKRRVDEVRFEMGRISPILLLPAAMCVS